MGSTIDVWDNCLDIWEEQTGGSISTRFWPEEFKDKKVQKIYTDQVLPKLEKTRNELAEF